MFGRFTLDAVLSENICPNIVAVDWVLYPIENISGYELSLVRVEPLYQ